MDSQHRLLSLGLALAPALLLLTSPAFAVDPLIFKGETCVTAPPVKPLHDGIYIGAAAGYDSNRIRSNVNTTLGGDTLSMDPVYNATGFIGGLFGGYGYAFKSNLYLGGEFGVNISGATANSTFRDKESGSIYTERLTVGTSFNVGLMPGYKINDSTLFYLRGGLTWADVQNRETFTTVGANASANSLTWVKGVSCGLGLESALYRNLSMRVEYVHTDYNDVGYSPFGTRASPVDNQFMLGLNYHIY